MQPEGLFTCSQEPSTGPYPEPDYSSPRNLMLPLQDPSYYYMPTYVLMSQTVSFLLASPITFSARDV
jgi:hypothetical protein